MRNSKTPHWAAIAHCKGRVNDRRTACGIFLNRRVGEAWSDSTILGTAAIFNKMEFIHKVV